MIIIISNLIKFLNLKIIFIFYLIKTVMIIQSNLFKFLIMKIIISNLIKFLILKYTLSFHLFNITLS